MKLVEITPVRELLYHPAELAAQLKEKLSRLSPKQRALCEETLRQDMELLRGRCGPARRRPLRRFYLPRGQ